MKVVGIGLNKTGTKTLRECLSHWGYEKHLTFDLDSFHLYQQGDYEALWETMRAYDSFEDWPWPLMYKEIDAQFPGTKFILTTRKNPEVWFTSLCKMAVRIGALNDFEQYIYGYAMPHGHKAEHIEFYEAHNRAVEEHFKDRPEQLLKVCWENGDGWQALADFLEKPIPDQPFPHINKSSPMMYAGSSGLFAKLTRFSYVVYQKVGKKIIPNSLLERYRKSHYN
ncbi:MAG: sulfotransferase family protein [Chloroflexota bacterium]